MPTINVLVVDDEEQSRYTTASALRAPDVHIRYAGSGEEAINVAREWHPDLILLDVMMPKMNGYDVCAMIRADPEIADIRVFMLTALDDREARLKGFEAGADDFITKPLHRSEIQARMHGITRLNRIRTLIEQQRMLRVIGKYESTGRLKELQLREVLEAFENAIQNVKLAFQPILMMDGGEKEFAYEVLMRSDEHRLPTPLAVLEAAGLLRREIEVGRAVRAALSKVLPDYPAELLLFHNVSKFDLSDEKLFTPNCPITPFADKVVMEITEREGLNDIDDLLVRINRLREIGYRFAVDDLGSGYAALNSLSLIQPEFVKLDRTLIIDIDKITNKQKIVSTIVHLCRELNISIIAEGIETEKEKICLTDLGCFLQQGFFHGHPSKEIRK
jgi:EAL domain-containing protein (putative c-di-GMP-specific phosphodiesterase class I)/CheY-like chemotaxis protein